jgi:hypothetical protein
LEARARHDGLDDDHFLSLVEVIRAYYVGQTKNRDQREITVNNSQQHLTGYGIQLSILKNVWSQFAKDCAEYAMIAVIFYWRHLTSKFVSVY